MFKHIDKATKIRTIVLIVVLANQFLVMFGMSPLPLDETIINEVVVQLDLLVSTIATVIVSLVSWWKDNDITKKTVDKKKDAGLK